MSGMVPCGEGRATTARTTGSPGSAGPPPADAVALLAGRRAHLVLVGESGARVLRYDAAGAAPLFLKTSPLVAGAEADSLGGEAARLRWMRARGLPVPEVLHHSAHAGREWLVTAAVDGVDASGAVAALAHMRSRDHARATRSLVDALADGLRLLHETPIDSCPFLHPAAARVAEAAVRVRHALVDESDFEAARRGRSAASVLDELAATVPRVEERVLTHGDYCLPNVILRREGDGWTLAGFVDCGRAGVADPHQDLALAARSLAFNLGDGWVGALFDRYGRATPDPERMAFYGLLDELF